MNEIKSLVSIITRTVDRPESLQKAIESVIKQSYPNIELIIINDGGCSVTNIIDKYKNKLNKIIYHELKQNKGRSTAANTGLKLCNGEFIAFLDDDDIIYPSHIENLVESIIKHKEYMVVYSGVETANNPQQFTSTYDKTELMINNYIPIHAILLNRKILEHSVMFDKTFEVYEDWDFLLQLNQHSDFFFTGKVTAYYSLHGSSGASPFNQNQIAEKMTAHRIAIYHKWRSYWAKQCLDQVTQYLFNMITDRDKTIEQNQIEIQKLITLKHEILNSKSWKITYPIRWLKKQLSKFI